MIIHYLLDGAEYRADAVAAEEPNPCIRVILGLLFMNCQSVGDCGADSVYGGMSWTTGGSRFVVVAVLQSLD